MSIMDNVQPVVKKETGRVSAITGIGLLIMWIVFGVLHAFMPQKVPFDYTVFYLSINRQQRKESRKKKNKVSFNRHL